MGYVTVSAKIPRKLKELLHKYGIKPGPIIKRALEEEVKKLVLTELEEEARRISGKLSHISDEEVVSLIREDREKR
uniref:CopG family transcriptional regulator n=1 Tax=Ignisphaera aggregans TaxID=334771 RepID=A0A7J2T9F0_9CREN